MLRKAVEKCPADHWEAIVGERPFWENAFHIAFYIDLYLTRPGEPWPDTPDWAWPNAAGLGRHMEPPFEPLSPEEIGPVLPQDKVAAYITSMSEKLTASLGAETDGSLAGESGFFWLPMTRAAAYLYNLRHVQHHAGQLCASLRRVGVGVDWVGMGQPA
ncbi:MAG: DinB family protein [Planctomycetota bacterium]